MSLKYNMSEKMMWNKLGLLYKPKNIHAKLKTHAANPLPVHITGDVFRVYFSGRDEQNRSSVGYVDIDILKKDIVNVCKEPLLVHGDSGSYYSHGISIGNIYTSKDNQYILFMGWQIDNGLHWRGDVGRIKVIDKDHMIIDGDTPFMGVDAVDEVSLSYPWVEANDDGSYEMWYGSTINWTSENGEMIHVLNHASSTDGDNWKRNGLSIPYELNVAQAFSRPTVLRDSFGYKMWFSYRSGTGEKYRIGYAEAKDGNDWKLELSKSGITVGPKGEWDDEMICYPYVFKHKGETYMLYNGNGNGKTGFGLAVWGESAVWM